MTEGASVKKSMSKTRAYALGVSENVVPPMMKLRGFRFEYWVLVILRSPVLESSLAPVALTYLLYASVARRMSVVPVSTIPAVDFKICVLPKRIA